MDRESSSTLHGSGRLVRNCRYYAPDTSSFARSQNSGQQTTKEGEEKKKKKKRILAIVRRPLYQIFAEDSSL